MPVGVYSYPSALRSTGLPSHISDYNHAGVIIRFNYRTNVYGAIVFDLEAPAVSITRNGTDWVTIV